MMKNSELFLKDPASFTIPNQGVAKIQNPTDREQWETLRWELSSFVCEGEYASGLERILSAFLSNLDKPEQPAVWVSGFYGSGKSHLVRVLEYLWRNPSLPGDSVSARSLVKLTPEIKAQLKELETAGKRGGGLWSAAGSLADSGNNVQLSTLATVFRAAGLPEKYPLARFVVRLKQVGHYDKVKQYVESKGKNWDRELNNLYVSPLIAQAMLSVDPTFATNEVEARQALRQQYPLKDDVTKDEFIASLRDLLELQSNKPGKLPCALLVLDEMQQFIGDSSDRALQVQNMVEDCCSRLGSRLMFVATGQAALLATPQLQKLQGRFTVPVTLSDGDVNRVVRSVILAKDQTKISALEAVLSSASGEISRHLAGTKIGASPGDKTDLVNDYPLLPVRRGFWEASLRAIDTAGKAGILRTQLRMIHEAASKVSKQPVGYVIPADNLYDQQKASMLQTGVLLPEINTLIEKLNDGTDDGKLRARLCALVLLIDKLPDQGPGATGVRANADMLADLLVEDLTVASSPLRQQVADALAGLVQEGTLLDTGGEYHLQTKESSAWTQDFKTRYPGIRANATRMAEERTKRLLAALGEATGNLKVTQGALKTPRKWTLLLQDSSPVVANHEVPVWFRDEWTSSEKTVTGDAIAAGTASPVVFGFLPKVEPEALLDALAEYATADDVIKLRPMPTTAEGSEARQAMESRRESAGNRIRLAAARIVAAARVFQGGGAQLNIPGTVGDVIRATIEASLIRQYPDFAMADHSGWPKVIERARQSNPSPLQQVGYAGDPDSHPVCKEILAFVGPAGRKGSAIRNYFLAPPYGWDKDAIDGALLTLVSSGFVKASRNTVPATLKDLGQADIGVHDFYSQSVIVTAKDRMAIRGLAAAMGFNCKQGEEPAILPVLLDALAKQAEAAGGDSPLPLQPKSTILVKLSGLSGNTQLVETAKETEAIKKAYQEWKDLAQKIGERIPQWKTLLRLEKHRKVLPAQTGIRVQMEAVEKNRSLLAEPDPVAALVSTLADALRAAFQEALAGHTALYKTEMARLTLVPEWNAIGTEKQAATLQECGLSPPGQFPVTTTDELLEALDRLPLEALANATAALPGKFTRVRQKAVQLVAPKAVRVSPKPATLKSVAEADDYLKDLRKEIVGHIESGNPVIV